jgi:hypothetical protein
VIIVELDSDLDSIISNKFEVSSADIGEMPKSSIIRSRHVQINLTMIPIVTLLV